MNKIILKLNHIFFKWYYKRVPKHFHQWNIIKSIKLLIDNYNHTIIVEKGLNEVISKAIVNEREMKSEILILKLEISSLNLRQIGVDQYNIDTINRIFRTNIKVNGE